jgi:hypothetical protein
MRMSLMGQTNGSEDEEAEQLANAASIAFMGNLENGILD